MTWAPRYTIMRGTAFHASYSTVTKRFSYNPFLNNGLLEPEGDPSSPNFYYGPTGIGPRGAGGGGLAQIRTCTNRTQFLAALAASLDGDIVEVTASFSTSLTIDIPAKSGSGWVLIRGSATALSAETVRPLAADFAPCKKITYTGGAAYFIRHAQASHGWHVRDLVVENGAGVEISGLWWWGDNTASTNIANMPTRFKMERVWLNNPFNNTDKFCARPLFLSGQYAMIRRCRIEGGCKNGSSDSQGIYMLHGLGDYQIIDNFVEGASENIAGGGGHVQYGTQNYLYNVHIEGNHLYKRPAWLTNVAGPLGGSTVYSQLKNFVESKHGKYWVVAYNYLENTNGAAQQHDIVFKVSPYHANEVPYLLMQDITIVRNYDTNGVGSFEFSTGDSHAPFPSITDNPTGRIEAYGNAFVDRFSLSTSLCRMDVGGFANSPTPLMFDIVVNHNWLPDTHSMAFLAPTTGAIGRYGINPFKLCNNISGNAISPTSTAFTAQAIAIAKQALDTCCSTTGWTVRKNAGVCTAGASQLYGSGANSLTVAPHNNIHFASLGTPGSGAVGSGSLGAELNADRTVKTASVLHAAGVDVDTGASDGLDIGPDWSELADALAARSADPGSVFGAFDKPLPLALTAAASVQVTGALSKALPLRAGFSASGSVQVDGALDQPVPLSLTASGSVGTTIAAVLNAILPFALAAAVEVQVTAAFDQPLPLALAAATSAQVTATLDQVLPLASSTTGSVQVTTDFDRPVPFAFNATAAAVVADINATFSVALPLTCTADTSVQVTAILDQIVPVTLTASVSPLATAVFDQPLPLTCVATGTTLGVETDLLLFTDASQIHLRFTDKSGSSVRLMDASLLLGGGVSRFGFTDVSRIFWRFMDSSDPPV